MKKKTSKKSTKTIETPAPVFKGVIVNPFTGLPKTYTNEEDFQKAQLPYNFRMLIENISIGNFSSMDSDIIGLINLYDFIASRGMIITYRDGDKSIHCTDIENVPTEEFIAALGAIYDDKGKSPEVALNNAVRELDKLFVRPYVRNIRKYITKWDLYTSTINNVITHDYRNKNTENITGKSWMSLNIDIQFKSEMIRNDFIEFVNCFPNIRYNDKVIIRKVSSYRK